MDLQTRSCVIRVLTLKYNSYSVLFVRLLLLLWLSSWFITVILMNFGRQKSVINFLILGF